jgi:predicted phosphoribosyltransferase
MFRDRNDAAERLVRPLEKYRGRKDAVVLAIPRGGLAIGAVLARELRLPLDVVLTKKIGHPQNSELAVGSVSLDAEHYDADALASEGVGREYLKEEAARLRGELELVEKHYRGEVKSAPIADQIVIVVDDGIATGQTMLAALALLRKQRPLRLVVAVPVASASASTLLSLQADEVISLETPENLQAIGQYYRIFGQLSDEEAVRLLREAHPVRI